MSNEQIKNLALTLVNADSERDVIKILQKQKLWDDKSAWKEVNESTGNWSTIGSQQSSADAALVEKIINSVDAVLMRECKRRGIAPESSSAPRSIPEAQKEYFGIYDGKLSSIDIGARIKLAENIYLVATGQKTNPSYSVIDMGEGQSPESFPDTFLSLNRSNKDRVHFVQGKFGMGGTGIFRHDVQGTNDIDNFFIAHTNSIWTKYISSFIYAHWEIILTHTAIISAGILLGSKNETAEKKQATGHYGRIDYNHTPGYQQ